MDKNKDGVEDKNVKVEAMDSAVTQIKIDKVKADIERARITRIDRDIVELPSEIKAREEAEALALDVATQHGVVPEVDAPVKKEAKKKSK